MGLETALFFVPLSGCVTFQSPLAARLDTECLARQLPFLSDVLLGVVGDVVALLFFFPRHEAGDVCHCAFLQSTQRDPVKWRLFVGQ